MKGKKDQKTAWLNQFKAKQIYLKELVVKEVTLEAKVG